MGSELSAHALITIVLTRCDRYILYRSGLWTLKSSVRLLKFYFPLTVDCFYCAGNRTVSY